MSYQDSRQTARKMAEYTFKQLPNSDLIKIPKAGHIWIMENMKTVLNKLINDK